MAEVLIMQHSETGGVAETTREAFEEVWQPLGWTELQENATKADLVSQAEARGITVPKGASKDDVAALLSGSLNPETPEV